MIGRRRRASASRGDPNYGPAPTAVRDPVAGWAACMPDPSGGRLWAAPFAEDLVGACRQAFDAFAGGRGDGPARPLTLPISVPFDENGVVVLSSAPPKPDAPRIPAELELIAGSPPDANFRFGLALARVDRHPLLVPGITANDRPAWPKRSDRPAWPERNDRPAWPERSDQPVPLTLLTFAVTDRGMAVAGYDEQANRASIDLDETTARALAVALLITIGVKLTKAGYSG